MKRILFLVCFYFAALNYVYSETLGEWTTIDVTSETTTNLLAASNSKSLTIQCTAVEYTINGDLDLSNITNDFSISINSGCKLIIKGDIISTNTTNKISITINGGGSLSVNSINVSSSISFMNNGTTTITGDVIAAGSGTSITVNGSSNLQVEGSLTLGTNTTINVDGILTVLHDVTGGTGSVINSNGTTSIFGDLTGFTLGNGASNIHTKLPIELDYFTAYQNKNSIVFSWATFSELNNHYFTIEASANGYNFTPVITQPGAGNSNVYLTYTTSIAVTNVKNIYYRLKQTDYNGQFAYSDIVCVNLKKTYENSWIANVLNNNINVKFSQPVSNTKVELVCVNGTVLKQHAVVNNANVILLNTCNLANGIYVVRVTNQQGFVSVQKVAF